MSCEFTPSFPAPVIRTRSGKFINLLDPDPATICIEDIAYALSNICRFNGHALPFYSVADHSIWVAQCVAPEFALQGLLHDASEAYLGDVSSPLKALLPAYLTLEKRFQEVIAFKFGLPSVLHESVQAADLCALATEKRDLLQDYCEWPALLGVTPASTRLAPRSSDEAALRFLRCYDCFKVL